MLKLNWYIMEIVIKNGHWLVNGKRFNDMNIDERNALNDSISEIKALMDVYRLLDEQRMKINKLKLWKHKNLN